MRISDRQWFGQHTQRIQENRQHVARLQEKLASGQEVNRPSDDPAAYSRLENIRGHLAELDTLDRNADAALRKLNTAEATMDDMFNVMIRARESVVSALNHTYNASDRADIAEEMKVMRDHFVQLSEVQVDDQYIFSGTASDAPPLDDTGAYQGAGAGNRVAIGEGAELEMAIDGSRLFDRDVNIVQMLDGIIADLESDDVDSLQGRIGDIGLAENQLLKAQTDLGARLRRVEVTTELTEDIRIQLSQESQDVGDADLAAVVSELLAQEQSLQAAVQVAGRTMTPSLLDVI
ncbi:MAG: flagellar hook-associated protein 3 [Myxococcales bacterium]|nr:flagellar hook-associated protein 3 [Myxococcales bacterium]